MNKTTGQKNAGLGVGYVTIMILFAVICLTVFAVISFRAAGSNDVFNTRAGEYLEEYYAADLKAKETLSQLCGIAENSRGTEDFCLDFELNAKALENVTTTSLGGEITAAFTVKINEKQNISAEITFSAPDFQYKIKKWQTVSSAPTESGDTLHVWTGNEEETEE